MALPDVVGQVWTSKERRIQNRPQHTNRASEAGHPCERYLVFSRTRWRDKQLHDAGSEFVFEGGRLIETMALRELEDAGFQLIEQQRMFEWRELELTGHVDAKMVADATAYPFDIKGLQHYSFDRMNFLQDFLNAKQVWLRKYPAQILLYLLMDNKERGFLYLKDKMTFRPKIVWFDLNDNASLDYAESVCKKLERVNAHVKAGTFPSTFDDPEVCEKCPFFHVCLPEIKQQPMEIMDDAELAAMLDRRAELKAPHDEYDDLHEDIKRAIKGKPRVMVGDWLITGKESKRGETVTWLSKFVSLKPQTPADAA